MARELDQDELIEHWTLLGDDLERASGKCGQTELCPVAEVFRCAWAVSAWP
jgi:hypothetical protein